MLMLLGNAWHNLFSTPSYEVIIEQAGLSSLEGKQTEKEKLQIEN